MIGVVRLPMLFGNGPCERFQPRPVRLYSKQTEHALVGHARVTKPWVVAEDGGCNGLEVSVSILDSSSSEGLPTLEYGYETPAAIVLAKTRGWCQIKLQSRTAWIRNECEPGFIPASDLLRDKLLYLLPGALELAVSTPGGTKFGTSSILRDAMVVHVDLLNTKTVMGVVWLQVSASHISVCEGEPPPNEKQTFWLPLSNKAGRLYVWFYSRGC